MANELQAEPSSNGCWHVKVKNTKHYGTSRHGPEVLEPAATAFQKFRESIAAGSCIARPERTSLISASPSQRICRDAVIPNVKEVGGNFIKVHSNCKVPPGEKLLEISLISQARASPGSISSGKSFSSGNDSRTCSSAKIELDPAEASSPAAEARLDYGTILGAPECHTHIQACSLFRNRTSKDFPYPLDILIMHTCQGSTRPRSSFLYKCN